MATAASPRKLKSAVVETTLRCDQACRFCGSNAGRGARPELSLERLRDAFEQVVRLGADTIELGGGEVHLREDWLEIIGAVRALGATCTLVTGGGIDEAQARRARDAGLARVGVSFDGPPEVHDSLRGLPGSFDRARRTVDAFRKAGVPVGSNTQLNARNWRELPRLADILLGEGLYGWQVQLMIPMGRASTARNLWLQPYEMLDLVPTVASVIERCEVAGLRVIAACNLGYFGPHERWLRKFTSRQGHTLGCGAGVRTISIDSDGNLAGCSALDASLHGAGNLQTDSIAERWENATGLRLGLVRSPAWGHCASCYYASVCRGGCSATSIALLGRRGNNPYCHHRALDLASQGQRERLVPLGSGPVGRRGYTRFELVREVC